jgi:hypothetical protein
MTKNLGKLSSVNLREVWEHESLDFSVWLANQNNFTLLCEAVGIDMEVIDLEVEVGKYRIDILAKESYSDEKIIIENQLEITDHDHLGKIVTYAAGLDAKYIIWIVKNARDEHLKAVQWLNENLGDEICIFLIKLELWRVDNSKPAPSFDILVKKNSWVEKLRAKNNNISPGEKYKNSHYEHLDFWNCFKNYSANDKSLPKSYSPRPQHWLSFSIKNKYGHVSAILNKQKDLIGVDFFIKENKDFYSFMLEYLKKHKSPYENQIVFYEASKASGYRVFLKCNNIFDKNKEIEYFDWLIKNLKITISLYSKITAKFDLDKDNYSDEN